MNYKKIIKSRKLRLWVLNLLNWVPDRFMISLQYRIHTGRKLNFRSPCRFSEKLQLYKLYYRNPLMLRCTDKFEVRKVIEEMGLGNILIPLIGVYKDPSKINFDLLPNEFVAKTTDGGGGSQVLICRDKTSINKKDFFKILQEWMSAPKGKSPGREWAYENGYPRQIIIEKLIKVSDQEGLPDYKFFCFQGKVRMVYGISGRKLGQSAEIGIYDSEFRKLEVSRNDERIQTDVLQKPEKYDEMVKISESIAKIFPHVRVDLYNVKDKIYFGELTFYDGSGYMSFTPDEFDETLGNFFDISSFCKDI